MKFGEAVDNEGNALNLTSATLADEDELGVWDADASAPNKFKNLTVGELHRYLETHHPWKEPVACATTANITLSGEQTIDGVTTSASRVLVKDQTDGTENGIYVSGSGAWTRATDNDSAAEFNGATVHVSAGAVNADRTYVCTTDSITLGTTSITWETMPASFGGLIEDLDTLGANSADGEMMAGTGAGALAWETREVAAVRLQAALTVATFAALASTSAANLDDGSRIWLNGYASDLDGGQGWFVVDKTNNVGGVFGVRASVTAGSSYTINGGDAGGVVNDVTLAGDTGSGGLCRLYFFEGALVDAVVTDPGSGYTGTISATISTAHADIDTGSGAAVSFTQDDTGMCVNSSDGTAVFRRITEDSRRINAHWFGVFAGGAAATNATRLQAAIDAAERDNKQSVHIPGDPDGNTYQINTTLYSGSGVAITGDGPGSFGSGGGIDSLIEMTSAGNTDIWRPRCIMVSSIYRVAFLEFDGIGFIHEKAATTGYAWNFIAMGATRTDEDYAVNVTGYMQFRDCLCRWCPDGGVNFQHGISAPGIVHHFLAEFTGGYGWDIRIQSTARSLVFIGGSGDGNQGGAFAKIDFETSYNNITFIGTISEARNDSAIRGNTPGGYAYAQPYCIEVNADSASAPLNTLTIIGGTYSNSKTVSDPTAYVGVTGDTSSKIPTIIAQGVEAALGTDSSDRGLLYDSINTRRIRADIYRGFTYNDRSPKLTGVDGQLSPGSNLPLTIADDAADSVAPPTGVTNGTFLISDGVAESAIFRLKVGSGAAAQIIAQSGSTWEVTTGALAGTTGTDAKYTVSTHTDGAIYVENRIGTSRTFQIMPLQLIY